MIAVKKVPSSTWSAIKNKGGEVFQFKTVDYSRWLIFIVRYPDKVEFFTPWDDKGNYKPNVIATYDPWENNEFILYDNGFDLIDENINSPKEFDCSICHRKNDVGVIKCWFCESKF